MVTGAFLDRWMGRRCGYQQPLQPQVTSEQLLSQVYGQLNALVQHSDGPQRTLLRMSVMMLVSKSTFMSRSNRSSTSGARAVVAVVIATLLECSGILHQAL